MGSDPALFRQPLAELDCGNSNDALIAHGVDVDAAVQAIHAHGAVQHIGLDCALARRQIDVGGLERLRYVGIDEVHYELLDVILRVEVCIRDLAVAALQLELFEQETAELVDVDLAVRPSSLPYLAPKIIRRWRLPRTVRRGCPHNAVDGSAQTQHVDARASMFCPRNSA